MSHETLEAVLKSATDADLSRWQADRLAAMNRADSASLEAHYANELKLIGDEIARRALNRQRTQLLYVAALCASWCFLGFALGHYVGRSGCQQIEVTR